LQAKVLTTDEARRIAIILRPFGKASGLRIARLPELLGKGERG
jgi:hypothetical protein